MDNTVAITLKFRTCPTCRLVMKPSTAGPRIGGKSRPFAQTKAEFCPIKIHVSAYHAIEGLWSHEPKPGICGAGGDKPPATWAATPDATLAGTADATLARRVHAIDETAPASYFQA